MLLFLDMNTTVTFIGENQIEVVYQVTYSTMAVQLAQLVEHWLLTAVSKVQSQVVVKSDWVIFPRLSLKTEHTDGAPSASYVYCHHYEKVQESYTLEYILKAKRKNKMNINRSLDQSQSVYL